VVCNYRTPGVEDVILSYLCEQRVTEIQGQKKFFFIFGRPTE